MNKGIFKSISLVVRYDSYHIGVVRGESILLPLTSFLVPLCSTMFPMFPMVDINIRLALGYLSFCKRKRWNQITQLVPGAHFLVARDVLARMWVYNRINIFIYCLFFVFVCLVVGSRNPMRIPDKSTTKHKTNNE